MTDGDAAVAREAIRDLIARYNFLGDSGRIVEMLELFVDDAVMTVDRTTYRGRSGIRELMETSVGPVPQRIRHFTSTQVIDLAGDTATAHCYFQVLTEHGLDHWGRYRDDVVRVDGRWLFARRDVKVDGIVAGGWAEQATARRHDVP